MWREPKYMPIHMYLRLLKRFCTDFDVVNIKIMHVYVLCIWIHLTFNMSRSFFSNLDHNSKMAHHRLSLRCVHVYGNHMVTFDLDYVKVIFGIILCIFLKIG